MYLNCNNVTLFNMLSFDAIQMRQCGADQSAYKIIGIKYMILGRDKYKTLYKGSWKQCKELYNQISSGINAYDVSYVEEECNE